MTGNATFRFDRASVVSVCGVDAPRVVTSAEFDDRLADTYHRVGLRPGLLEGLAGIVERRWWPRDVSFSDAAAMAGAKALAEAGVDAVRRRPADQHLGEPGAPGAVRRGRGAPRARPAHVLPELRPGQRLPRLRQRHAAGRRHDRRGPDRLRAGRRRRGRPATPTRPPSPGCSGPTPTREDVLAQFATLTLGSGRGRDGARAARTRTRRATGSSAASTRAGTEHHLLCVGDIDRMHTDTKGLLDARPAIVADAVARRPRRSWTGPQMDRYVTHQVTRAHTRRSCTAVGHRPGAGPAHVPAPGQRGPASLPMTLAASPRTLSSRRPGAVHGRRFRPEHRHVWKSSGERASCPRPSAPTVACHRRASAGSRPDWSPAVTAATPTCGERTWHVLDNSPGRGPSRRARLLCVHGNPTWSYLWRTLLAAEADPQAWRVVAVDQLDMGFSERTGTPRALARPDQRPGRPHRRART